VYSGQYNGSDSITFRDGQGIDYNFPLRDVETLVFSQANAPASSGLARVFPRGTEIVVRRDKNIDSDNSTTGQLFTATVSEDVPDSSGGIAIGAGTRAKRVVRNITGGGAVHSPELALDLVSVDIGGKEYRVDSSDVGVNSGRGVGKNKRTLGYGAGGAGFGARMGAIFGGRRGAGIGAAAGGRGIIDANFHARQTGEGACGNDHEVPTGSYAGAEAQGVSNPPWRRPFACALFTVRSASPQGRAFAPNKATFHFHFSICAAAPSLQFALTQEGSVIVRQTAPAKCQCLCRGV
jgi:hypothetical protein